MPHLSMPESLRGGRLGAGGIGMPRPQVQITIRLGPEVAKQLEMLAKEKEQSLSGFISEIVEAYLAKQERRPPR